MGLHTLTEADLAAVARATPDLASLAVRIGDRLTTYQLIPGEGVAIDESTDTDADVVVAMSAEAWADLTTQMRTIISLFLANELTLERGEFLALMDWGPLLTRIHNDVPLYDPTRVDLSGVDLTRTFTLDDSDEDMRAYLETTGYLHVKGVFSADEIAALNAEVDRLAAMATRGATTSRGGSPTRTATTRCAASSTPGCAPS